MLLVATGMPHSFEAGSYAVIENVQFRFLPVRREGRFWLRHGCSMAQPISARMAFMKLFLGRTNGARTMLQGADRAPGSGWWPGWLVGGKKVEQVLLHLFGILLYNPVARAFYIGSGDMVGYQFAVG